MLAVRFAGKNAVETSELGGASDLVDPGSIYLSLKNPIVFDRPRYGTELELFAGEGRAHLSLAAERDVSRFSFSGPRRSVRAQVSGTVVYDPEYLAPGRWSSGTNQAGEAALGLREERGPGVLDLEGSVGIDT